jgi:hypothetical protein
MFGSGTEEGPPLRGDIFKIGGKPAWHAGRYSPAEVTEVQRQTVPVEIKLGGTKPMIHT